MLTLIGLGLFDEKDLSLRAIEQIRDSDSVFLELYTGKWSGNIENLKKMTGKKIELLNRSDLEENSSKTLPPTQAVQTLREIENLKREEIFTPDSDLVLMSGLGSAEPEILFGKARNFLKIRFEKVPSVIIVPGNMHFSEKEYLDSLRMD